MAGHIILDAGACEALQAKGKSLLSVGISKVTGQFAKGDLVSCLNPEGEEIARGLTNFDNQEMDKIKGLNSNEIKDNLGYLSQEEVIHRNNLVLS